MFVVMKLHSGHDLIRTVAHISGMVLAEGRLVGVEIGQTSHMRNEAREKKLFKNFTNNIIKIRNWTVIRWHARIKIKYTQTEGSQIGDHRLSTSCAVVEGLNHHCGDDLVLF